ncbi:SDR family NAD(P)-dependent oxidoreductase [Diaphorobacter caeni]|uniref:SDR family NAD(P)-dependent oxidoreductase n=1 Tax=Diaphorobacter caeni TaxID=2784387 RepID=UPI0018906E55|nr:SDR family oxidoreductase [Diaphorobacter caeni]MBF5007256.1 SDR family oxidoreductase [Diaphorobacter caeni]
MTNEPVPGHLHGRVALITGGASGIGLATAQLLRSRGATVLVADVQSGSFHAISEAVGVECLQIDVVDRTAVQRLHDALAARHLAVDLLVNCAGIVQSPLSPDLLDSDVFQRTLAISLEGTFNMCAVFGSSMAKRGRGAVVNIASVAGMRSMPLHAYSPAKAGIISLTEGLAAEWGRSGVRVNTVSPGYTVTAALQSQIDAGLRDPEKLASNSALGRLIMPGDIAKAIAFLLSDEASMITGINLPVDAGWLVSGSWSTFGGVRESHVMPG